MARYPSSYSYSFGPGGLTPAIKALIVANVAMYLVNLIVPAITIRLGLVPAAEFGELALWQPVTYMFLHDTGGVGHILINMLSLWMFGTELERMSGTRFLIAGFMVGFGCSSQPEKNALPRYSGGRISNELE